MRKIEDINIWAFNPNDDVVKELNKLPKEQLEDVMKESFKERVHLSLYLGKNQNLIMEMNLYQAIKTYLWLKIDPLTYDVALKRHNQDVTKPFFHNLNEIFPPSIKNELLKDDVVFFEFSETMITGEKKVIAKDKNDVKSYGFSDNISGDKTSWNKFIKHLIKTSGFAQKIISNKTINLQGTAEDKKDRVRLSQVASSNYLKCLEDIYQTTKDVFPDMKNMAVYLTDRLQGGLTNVDEAALREEDVRKLVDFQSDFINQSNIEDVKHLNDLEATFKAESPIARALMNKILQDNMISKGFPKDEPNNSEDDKDNKMFYMI